MTNTTHIQLLSKNEIADLYDRPDFNSDERKLYLTISEQDESCLLNHYSTLKTRIYFILQLGYFKAKHQFFDFYFEDVRNDVDYIISHFSNVDQATLSGRISRNCIRQQKNDILQLFDYQDWSSKHEPQIESHLCELLRYYPKYHSLI